MTIQELYTSGILEAFSTYTRLRKTPERTREESRLVLLSFLSAISRKNVSSASELTGLLERSLDAHQASPQVAACLSQFVNQYPPHQAGILLHQYLLALSKSDCSVSTIKNYRSDINQFFNFSEQTEIEKSITKTKVQAFARLEREHGRAHATIKRKLISLTQFVLWLERMGAFSGSSFKWLEDFTKSLPSSETDQMAPGEALDTDKTRSLQVPHYRSTPTRTWHLPVHDTKETAAPVLSTAGQAGKGQANQEYRNRLATGLMQLQSALSSKSKRSFVPYLNAALLVLIVIGLGFFGYRQFFTEPDSPLAFPSSLTRPNRTLSFQGRLTDTAQNPITSATDFRFKLYDSGPSIVGGTVLWDSTTCSVTPDQDGIFAAGLGDDCGSEIDASVFSENSNVWLEVEVESETLDPRQSIKTVAYALNSETLQGYPASASAVENTVLVMDNSGEVVLGNTNPVLKATGASFAIEAETLTLRTSSGSDGDIILAPDGLGTVIAQSYLAAPGATLSATYAGGTSLVLRGGPSGTANIQEWQDSTGTALSVVDESGNLGIGTSNPSSLVSIYGNNEALAVGDGTNVAAYSSFAATRTYFGYDGANTVVQGGVNKGIKFNVNNATFGSGTEMYLTSAGNLGIGTTNPSSFKLQVNGDIGPQTDATFDLGSASLAWDNIYGTTLYQDGNIVCDASGNCGNTNLWANTLNVFHPRDEFAGIVDLVIGGTSTASADFQVIGSGANAGYTYGRRFIDIDATSYYVEPGSTGIAGAFAGSVGIGTTNPAQTLDVIAGNAGAIRFSNTATDATTKQARIGSRHYTNAEEDVMLIHSNNDSTTNLLRLGGGVSSHNAATQIDFYTGANNTTVTGTSRMTILSDGNVGIGTTNPPSLLAIQSTGNSVTDIQYLDSVSSNILFSVGETSNNDGVLRVRDSAGSARVQLTGDAASVNYLSDNVGIGTTNPETVLHVESNSSTTNFLILEGNRNTSNTEVGILFKDRSAIATGQEVSRIYSDRDSSSGNFDLVFHAGSQAGAGLSSEILRLQGSSSNVGIGTTNPSSFKLQLTGDIGPSADDTYDLGSGALQWDNIYGKTLYQDGNQVCDTTGNCTGSGLWANTLNVFHPKNEWAGVVDLIIGGTATASADFRVQGQNAVDGTLAGYTYGRRFIDIDATSYYVEPGNTSIAGAFAGNVGVGVTNPSAHLEIESNLYDNMLELTRTGQGSASFMIGSTGYPLQVITSASKDIQLVPAGTTTLTAASTGNVGIGSTAPTDKLQIAGGGITITNSTAPTLTLDESAGNSAASGKISFVSGASENAAIQYNANDDYLHFDTFEVTNALTIKRASGNVGIGTTNAAALLEVAGGASAANIRLSSNIETYLDLYADADNNTANDGGVRLYEGTTARYTMGYDASANIFSIDSGSALDNTNFFTIGATGNVGIGTTAPTAKLEIIGSSQAANGGSSHFEIVTGTGASADDRLLFGVNDGSYSWIQATEPSVSYRNLVLNALGGNVGIGTTSPGEKLQVNGNIRSFGDDIGFIAEDDALNLNYTELKVTGFGQGMSLLVNAAYDGTGDPLDSANVSYKVDPGSFSTTAGLLRYNGNGGQWEVYTSGVSTGLNDPVTLTRLSAMSQSAIYFSPSGSGDDLYINSNGNVGIGDSTPDAALDLVGDAYVSGGISLYETSVSNGTIEATEFCTGDGGGATCISDFGSISTGASIWTDAGTYIRVTNNEVLGNSASAGSNKIAGLYLADSAPLVFGTDNDVTFNFSGSTLAVTQGSNDINFDSNTLFIDGSASSVGIGTTSPTLKLTVQHSDTTVYSDTTMGGDGAYIRNVNASGVGGTYSSLRMLTSSNSSSSNAIGAINLIQPTNGSHDANFSFQLRNSGGTYIETMRMLSNGNIGIGTTAPIAKLELVGVQATTPGGADANYSYENVLQYHLDAADQTGALVIDVPDSGSNTMMSIRISGYNYDAGEGAWEAIIGGYWYDTSNTWINSSITITGTPPFDRVRLMTESTAPRIVLGDTGTDWDHLQINVDVTIAGFAGQDLFASGWSAALETSLAALTADEEPTIKYYVDSSGRFGIGTTGPAANLHISDPNTADPVLRISSTSSTYDPQIQLYRATGTGVGSKIWLDNSLGRLYIDNLYNSDNGDIYFRTRTLGTPIDALTIKGSGNVGIGTTSPAAKLHSFSTTEQLRLGYDASNYASFTTNSSGALNIATTGAGTNSITLSAVGGNINFTETSNSISYQASQFRPFTADDDEISLGSVTARWSAVHAGTGTSSFAGNVGIGTTAPLAVIGTANYFAGVTPKAEILTGTSSNTYEEFVSIRHIGKDADAELRRLGLLFKLHNEATDGESDKSGGMVFESSATHGNAPFLHLVVADAARLSISSTGNIGIGSTNPDVALDIVGDTYVSGGISLYETAVSNGTIEATKFCTGDGETNCTTDFAAMASGASIWTDAGSYIYTTNGEVLGNSASAGSNKIAGLYLADSAPLVFGTDNDISATFSGSTLAVTQGSNDINFDANTLVIDGSANRVGIGTTAPERKLSILDTSDASLYIRKNTTTTSDYSEILFGVSTAELYHGGIRVIRESGLAGEMAFFTQNTSGANHSTLAEQMRITNDGLVGIGTTDPLAKLNSLATTEQLRLSYDASNYASFTTSSGGDLTIAPSGGDANLTGTLDVSSRAAIGANGSVSSTQTLHVQENYSSDAHTYQVYSLPTLTGTLTADRTSYGAFFDLIDAKTENIGSGFDSTTTAGYFRARSTSGASHTFQSVIGAQGIGANYSETASDLGTVYGLYGEAQNMALTSTIANMYGVYGQSRGSTNGSVAGATITNGYGAYFDVTPYHTNVTNAYGFRTNVNTVNNYDGDITQAYGVYSQVQSADTSGDATITTGRAGYFIVNRSSTAPLLTNAYGVQITASDATNVYGLHISTVDADATTNYGIYLDSYNAGTTNYGIYGVRGDWVLDEDGNGSIGASGATGGGDLALGESQDLRLFHSGTHSYITNYTGDLYIGDTGTDDVILSSNGGLVGVGTTNPLAPLDVAGDIYLTSGLSTFRTAVSNGTIEATKFCTGDGETNCTTDFASMASGASIWTDAGTYIYTTNGEVLGNSTSAGANKIAGLYLADSAPLVFGTDNDITFDFSGSTLAVTQGSNDINFDANTLFIDASADSVAIGKTTPNSILNIYQNDTGTSTGAGLTVEQDGTGDALVQYLLTGAQRWVSGVDNSDGDKFKIASSADLNTDAVLTIDTAGNVGIGTTAPIQKLNILGTSAPGTGAQTNISAYVDNGIRINGSGTSTQDAITYQSGSAGGGAAIAFGRGFGGYDTFMNFYTNAAASASAGSISNLALSINSNGNVGIGGVANASSELELDGIFNFTDTAGNLISHTAKASYDKIRVWNSNLYTIGMNSAQSYGYLNDYAMTFTMSATVNRGFLWRDASDAASDGAMSLTTDGRLTVKSTSNFQGTVGIGNITTPAAYLDVTGSTSSTNSLRLRSGNAATNFNSNQILLSYNGTANYSQAIKSRSNGAADLGNAIDFYTWDFGTDAVGDAGTLHAMSLNGGNVGIGNTNPATKLDILGAPTDELRLITTVAGNATPKIHFRANASGYDSWIYQDTYANLTFDIESATNTLILTPGGNVGIGTTNAIAKMTVYDGTFADSRPEFTVYDGVYNFNLGYDSKTTGTNYLSFYRNSSNTYFDNSTGSFNFLTNSVNLLTLSGNATESIITTPGYPDFRPGHASYGIIIRQVGDAGDWANIEVNETWLGLSKNSGDTHLAIEDSGYVGIGTTDPAYNLDVAGAIRADYITSSNPWNIASSGIMTAVVYSASTNNTGTLGGYVIHVSNNGGTTSNKGMLIQAGHSSGTGTSTLARFNDGDGTLLGEITFTGNTITYGNFTGSHNSSIPEEYNSTGYEYGTVLCYDQVTSGDEKQPTYSMKECSSAYQTTVSGVYGSKFDTEPNKHLVFAVGDGHALVTLENGPIKKGDSIVTSSYAGYGMKATKAGVILGVATNELNASNATKTVTLPDGRTVAAGLVPVYYYPGVYYPGPNTTFSSEGELVITGDNGDYTATPVGKSALTNVFAAAKVVTGKLQAGLVQTKELVVENSAQIASLSVNQMNVAGQTLQNYVKDIVWQELQTAGSAQMATYSGQLATGSAQLDTILVETATVSGTLVATDFSAQKTQLGSLLAGDATISGTLAANNLEVAGSTRLNILEAQQANLDQVRANTAELLDATVSGTLYATNINGLEDKIAQTLQKPNFLDILLRNDEPQPVNDNPIDVYTVVESAGYEINPDLMASAGATLAFTDGDVMLNSQAAYVQKYLQVNGLAYVADSLGVGNSLFVGNSTQISDGVIAFTPSTENDTLRIQPSGQGKLEFLAGLMTLEDGQVRITGNVYVAGAVQADTLLTNLVQPADFGNPFQVQVAGVSSTSGQLEKSRFEIINELGTPVATISAEGKAAFAGGIGIGSENSSSPEVASGSAATITTTKTSGKAELKAGSPELIIENEQITADSLIYVTPVGSTQNQVLYVKSQTAEDPATSEKEGKFRVGFDQAIGSDVSFNWWIVN